MQIANKRLMNAVFTIIIPHKNTPKLLQRCLDSIPQREDVEIIIVDDNSSPDIVNFNKFPGLERHDTEVYFDKTGKGAGRARNVGLRHATGDWLIFADADDYFYDNAFEEFDRFVHSGYDMVYFYCNARDGVTNELIPDRIPHMLQAIQSTDYDTLRYKTDVPWGKMIKKEIVDKHNLLFEEIQVSNDIAFSIRVGYYSQSIGLIDKPLYCVTRNESSLFFKNTPQRILTRMDASIRKKQFLKRIGKDYPMNFLYYAMQLYPNHPILFVKSLCRCKQDTRFVVYVRDIVLNIYRAERKRIGYFRRKLFV